MNAVGTLGAWLAGLVGNPVPPDLPGRGSIALAESNGVAALLATAVRDDGRDPPDALKVAQGREVAMALRSDGVADAILQRLDAVGIDVIALKGLALRRALYQPRGWVRVPGDLDLLVRPDQVEAAREELDAMGFEPSPKHPRGFYRSHHHIRPRLLRDDAAVVVDLHHALLKPPHPFTVDLDALWDRSVPLEGGPGRARRLEDHDLALHTILQVDHDDAYGGKGRALLDILLWRDHRDLEDGRLEARAREFDGDVACARFRAALSHVFGLPLPPGARAGAWGRILPRAAWRREQGRGLPVWYLYWCARVLRDDRPWPATAWQLVRPVLANPRVGGGGFRED